MKLSLKTQHNTGNEWGNEDNCDCQGKMCSLGREVNKERDQLQSSGRGENRKIEMGKKS